MYLIGFIIITVCTQVPFLNASASIDKNIEKIDEQGQTVIHRAAANGNSRRIRKYISKGSNIQLKDSHNDTPLHIACKNGHLDCVKELLEAGARVDSFNKDRDAPIHLAAKRSDPSFVRLLIEKGSDIDIQTLREEHTPLHIAAFFGNTETCKVLLENGAHPTLRNCNNDTCLDIALENKHFDTARLLESNCSSS